MSGSVGKIATPREFFDLVVAKDLAEFRADQGDIRKSWHCATSLFHQADWVFHAHRMRVIQDFSLPAGTMKETDFADALARSDDDFQLIQLTLPLVGYPV